MTRSQTLDLLRTVAILLVLGHHMESCPREISPFVHSFTQVWVRGGWIGVDLFFVLSGFLISGLLFREHQKYGSISFKNFFLRRGLKIYPPFIVLTLLTVLKIVLHHDPFPYDRFWHDVFFLQSYGGGIWHHSWSLSVEEHFYILLPLTLFLALRFGRSTKQENARPFGWIPKAFALTALMCLGLRLYTASRAPFTHTGNLFPTHLRLDSLFAGVALSYYYHYFPTKFRAFAARWRAVLLPAAVACFVPAFVFPLETTPFLYTFGFSLFWCGAALLLFCVVDLEPRPTWPTKSLAFCGSRSYSIYLWHNAVAGWGVVALGSLVAPTHNWYLYFAFYMVGAFLLGIFMAYIVEHPTLKVRDRWFPSRSQPLETSDNTTASTVNHALVAVPPKTPVTAIEA